ncbi:hypothetical protein CIHG_09851, partial [Coccidioides immitis H538.4]
CLDTERFRTADIPDSLKDNQLSKLILEAISIAVTICYIILQHASKCGLLLAPDVQGIKSWLLRNVTVTVNAELAELVYQGFQSLTSHLLNIAKIESWIFIQHLQRHDGRTYFS